MSAPPRDSLARSPLLVSRTRSWDAPSDDVAAVDDGDDSAAFDHDDDDDDLAQLAASDAASSAPYAQVSASRTTPGALELRSREAPRELSLASVMYPRELLRLAASGHDSAAQLAFVAALDRALLRWRVAAALFWFSVSLVVLAPLGWSVLAMLLHEPSATAVSSLAALSLPTAAWWALQCAAVVALAVARGFHADVPHRARTTAAAWRFVVRLAAVAAALFAAAACALAVKSMRTFAAAATTASADALRGSLWPFRLCVAAQPELGQCIDADVVADWLAALLLAALSTWLHVRSDEFVDVYPSVERRRLDRFRARFAAVVLRSVAETLATAFLVFVLLDGSGALVRGAELLLGGVVRPRPRASLAAVAARFIGFALGGGISCFAWRAMRTVLAIVSTEVVDVELLASEALPASLRSARSVETPNLLALRLHDTSPAVRLVAAAALARAAQRAPLRRRLWSDADGRALEPLLQAWTVEIRRCAWVLHCAMSRGSGRAHDAALWPDAPPPQLLGASYAQVRQHYTARRRRRQALYERILDEMPPLAMVGFRFRHWLRHYVWRDKLSGDALTRSALPDGGQLVLFAVRSLAALLAAAPAEDQFGVCKRLDAAPRATAALDQLIFALDLYCLSGLAHGDSGDALQTVSDEALLLAPPIAALPSAATPSSMRAEATPGRAAVRLAARQPRRAAASAVRQLPATPYALAQAARQARRTIAHAFGS